MVAGPNVVGRDVVQRYVLGATDERLRFGSDRLAAGQNVNGFELRQRLHQLLPDGRNRLELARPGVRIVRPGQPGGGVRLPFGRKAISQGRR